MSAVKRFEKSLLMKMTKEMKSELIEMALDRNISIAELVREIVQSFINTTRRS